MSSITDYILTFSVSEETCGRESRRVDGRLVEHVKYQIVEDLNRRLSETAKGCPFANLDAVFAGKVCYSAVWGVSISFPEWWMAWLVLGLEWKFPDQVQLMAKHETSDRFSCFGMGNLIAIAREP